MKINKRQIYGITELSASLFQTEKNQTDGKYRQVSPGFSELSCQKVHSFKTNKNPEN
jgi:hypothetical protein